MERNCTHCNVCFNCAKYVIIFLKSLSHNSLTVMNLLWDVMSDISVSIIGLFYFKEKLTRFKKLGVFFSLISIILLTYKDGDD